MSKRIIQPVDQIPGDPLWDRAIALGAKDVVARQKMFEEAGIIDSEGRLLIKELPPDMQPGSKTTT